MLFVPVPFVPLIKNGCKTQDQQQSDQENDRIEICAIGFHVGPLIPAGRKIDDNWYNEQEPNRNPDQELNEDLFAAKPVCFPVSDKIFVPL